jgi:hypothetical protein
MLLLLVLHLDCSFFLWVWRDLHIKKQDPSFELEIGGLFLAYGIFFHRGDLNFYVSETYQLFLYGF